MNFQPILRRLAGPELYDKLEKYRPTEAQMPLAYQNIPGGRPLHNDFGIMDKLAWAQPWQKITRLETARRSPYPWRIKSGLKKQVWYPLDPTYPLSPGAVIGNRNVQLSDGQIFNVPHVLIDDAIDGGGWTVFEAWIDGEWVEACKRYSKMVPKFDWESKKFVQAMFKHYQGYKCDTTVVVNVDGTLKSDVMGWIEFPTFSWNRMNMADVANYLSRGNP